MGEHETIEPQYAGAVGGAYSTEEHLRAQQEQVSAVTGKPLHDPETVVHPPSAGDHDDPAAADPEVDPGQGQGDGSDGGDGQGDGNPGTDPGQVPPLG